MKYLYQAAIIILFTFLGEMLSLLIPLGIPAAIWGLILLFLALCTGIVKLEQIKECSAWLLAILPALFVVPTVNLMDQATELLKVLPAFVAIILISSVVTFAVTGHVTQFLQGKGREERHD